MNNVLVINIWKKKIEIKNIAVGPHNKSQGILFRMEKQDIRGKSNFAH